MIYHDVEISKDGIVGIVEEVDGNKIIKKHHKVFVRFGQNYFRDDWIGPKTIKDQKFINIKTGNIYTVVGTSYSANNIEYPGTDENKATNLVIHYVLTENGFLRGTFSRNICEFFNKFNHYKTYGD